MNTLSTKLLDTTTCPICFIKVSNSNLAPPILPCGCQTCPDCLAQWIISKISSTQHSLDEKISCPVDTCQKKFTLQEIYSNIPQAEKARINEELLKSYLNTDPQIQKCPKQGCDYALVIDTPITCSKELQCELCQTKWKAENHSRKSFFNKLRDCKKEILSFFWKIFKTKKCPGCKVRISREPEGCSLITCTQCGMKFCWDCGKEDYDCDHQVDYEGRPNYGLLWLIIILWLGMILIGFGALFALEVVGGWVISWIGSLLT